MTKAIATEIKTTDGLRVYDLDPAASELWAVAGPDGYDLAAIDPDALPDGFRWVTEAEWAVLNDGETTMNATTTCTTIHATEATTIEVDQDGRYYLTSNAMTRELVTPWIYAGWDQAAFRGLRGAFVAEGMAAEHADGYIRQAMAR